MENKMLLLGLIEKNRNLILNDKEYLLAVGVLEKLNSFVIINELGEVDVDFNKIGSITEEELSVFTLDSIRIIAALLALSTKSGWRVETVKKLISKLEQEIINNKTDKVLKDKSHFDKLYKIIDSEEYMDNYMMIFDFIDYCVDNEMVSLKEAIALNFYLLKECSVNSKTYNDMDIEIATVKNDNEYYEMIDAIKYIFMKNGYMYDESKLKDLEDKFIKYIDFDYMDYVLSKFCEYNISDKDLYVRIRSFYAIIIDNDRESFDAILAFIDNNNCNLKTLLSIPSIFSKKKRRYRERNKSDKHKRYFERDLFEIYGVQQDFFINMELYKNLTGVENMDDTQLVGLSKFLCTPSSVVSRNLQLLRLYKIVDFDKFPKAVVSLCGTSVEYLIDRYIECGLYEQYLITRYNNNGEKKEPRGTSYLDRDNNPFRFYKLKLASNLGYNVFATNMGIQKAFYDNNLEYSGLSLIRDEKGMEQIVQKVIPIDREIPDIALDEYFGKENASFELFYRYKIMNPINVFANSTNVLSKLKGERINGVFLKDYKYVLSGEDVSNIEKDSIISMLDNSVCTDSYGNSFNTKVNEFKYEFVHHSIPNVKVIVSRYKVLRLCKLLKEDGSWVNNEIDDDMLNTIMCVMLKDSIVSEAEIMVLKHSVREILINSLVTNKTRKRG